MANPMEIKLPNGSGGFDSYDVKTSASLVTGLSDKYRQNNTVYAAGDALFHSGLSKGLFLECTTAGTSGSTDITIPSSITVNATTITDGTVTWTIRKLAYGDGIAVGIILPFAGNGAIPSGYLLCDGAAYSRTAFPDLFAAIGTDYGSGDGSTTFNVPDANQAKRFLQGDVTAGQTKSAGLPNITGNIGGFNMIANQSNLISGAFAGRGMTGATMTAVASGDAGASPVSIDASRSSTIYGNSDTVQPNALTTRYIIKAFDGQTADSALIDITQFENELGGKADRSLSNLTDAGKSFSFPSDTYVSIPLTTDTTTSKIFENFVAPADGFVDCIGTTTGVFSNFELRARGDNTGSGYTPFVISNAFAGGSIAHASIPVKKGMFVSLISYASTSISSIQTRFVYANGEVPN